MRRCTGDILYAVAMTAALSCWSCSQESSGPVPEADPGYRTIVLSLSLGTENPLSRGDFDNFDNEADKWGVQGENIESLRIIILDGRNVVEHNSLYTLDNDTEAGEYRFSVSDNDTKTIIFICNEDGLTVRPEDSPASDALSLSDYLRSISEGGTADVAGLRRMVVDFDPNSVDGAGTSLRRPLPITAIYNEYIAAGVEDISREYELRRAAVKYSFRIINKSAFAQTLDAIRIDRVADREYLFPAETGQGDTRSYSTPAGAAEKTLRIKPAAPLSLPAGMTQAVAAMEPVYVPEGIISELPRRVSLALDGTDLDLWQNLRWRMPGESEAVERSMADLPRNTHVVVNITITAENQLDIVADVQPYAEVKVDPWFGLDRDEDGNIIVERYDDGTYDIILDGTRVNRDADGDRVLKKFADGSMLVEEVVRRDYIHDGSEIDYTYQYEKDRSGGMMVIIRERSTGGDHHDPDVPVDASHEHGTDDRPLFMQDKDGVFVRADYSTGVRTLSHTDVHGDSIIQANGFQFREKPDEMSKYYGTYIVLLADGVTEELRYYKDGRTLDWNSGTAGVASRSAQKSPAYISAELKKRHRNALRGRYKN